MLEARFPRIPGDVGNATTWPFPVLYKVVRGASPDRVVQQRAEGLLDAFVAAGRELVADGRRRPRHQLRVPVAVSGRACRRLRGAGRDLGAAAGAADRASAAARPAGRHPHRLRGQPDARSTWQRPASPLDTPVVGTEGGGRSRARCSATSSSWTSPPPSATSWTPATSSSPGHPEVGAVAARVHQHVPLRGRAARSPRSAGVRHGQLRHLVPRRPRAPALAGGVSSARSLGRGGAAQATASADSAPLASSRLNAA